MALPLSREEIEQSSSDLEGIISAHMGWFKQLNRALVCGADCLQQGPMARELGDAPERQTTFGKWYYREGLHPLADHPAFADMGRVQVAMHTAARHAITTLLAGQRPSPEQYDACIDLSLRLNTLLRHLQLEIIGDLLATDTLTGCYSRRGMLSRLRAEQARAQRIQRPCAICLLDFDHFKQVNDQLGHPAGDAVLRQGMRFVMSGLRKYDSIYRYGGEEFLICLPGTPLNDALPVIERIRAGLQALDIALPSGETHHVTASFGLAEMQAQHSVEDAIETADQALILAKGKGRNRVETAAGSGLP